MGDSDLRRARVCITIDTEFPDQPAADPLGVLDRQLEILAAHDVAATFFVVGVWARANADRVLAIRSAGHEIGNHSYSHRNLATMTRREIVDDLTQCHDAIAELGIETRPLFRAPFGEMARKSSDIRDAVKGAGYEHVPWHAHGEDWRPGVSSEEIVEKTLREVKRRWPRRAIVALHSWPDPAAAALALLIETLQSRRAEFSTIGQTLSSRR